MDWAGTVGRYQYQITVPGGAENDGKHAVPLHCGQFSLKIRPQPMVEKRPQPMVEKRPQPMVEKITTTSGRNLTTTRPGSAPSLTRPETVKRNCNSLCYKLGLHI